MTHGWQAMEQWRDDELGRIEAIDANNFVL
jgi:hypothetical protein